MIMCCICTGPFGNSGLGGSRERICQGSSGDLINMCQMELLLMGKGLLKFLFCSIACIKYMNLRL